MSFSPEELERYARHIVLREVGGPGQQKLKRAHVTVIGAGGLGSPALLYLAAAGVGTLRIIDDDQVALSNLQRQVLHDTAQVGAAKTESAVQAIARINPHVVVEPRATRLTASNAEALLEGTDLVLDGTDSYATRALVNETSVRLGLPLLSGAISQWEGQVSLFHPASGTPCYACLFPQEPAEGQAPSCAEAGVMGALAGVIGSMMAGEALKWITGAGRPLLGQMLVYD
ncbi:MAG: HesA/MoeB/ThiF family protein, partial [Pseudomonadota bacterium]